MNKAISMQEIFTRSAVHLLRQNAKSAVVNSPATTGDGLRCMYRGPQGTKCAVGNFIPDELYSFRLEGKSVETFDVQKALREAGVISKKEMTRSFGNLPTSVYRDSSKVNLLSRLQKLHDTVAVTNWHWALSNLAQELGLQMPDLDMIDEMATASPSAQVPEKSRRHMWLDKFL